MIKKILSILFITFYLIANLYAESEHDIIILSNGSNIYTKTMLFFLPLTKPDYLEHTFTFRESGKVFDSIVTINKSAIYNKPVIGDIFSSDFFIRIQNIPYENITNKKIQLPITIRMNQTVIERQVTFKIKYSKGIIQLLGQINDLRISDIKKEDYYPKRRQWKIPILIDFEYKINL